MRYILIINDEELRANDGQPDLDSIEYTISEALRDEFLELESIEEINED